MFVFVFDFEGNEIPISFDDYEGEGYKCPQTNSISGMSR